MGSTRPAFTSNLFSENTALKERGKKRFCKEFRFLPLLVKSA
jgi:hypothetical protein